MDKDILAKIKQGFETFRPSEKKIAKFILDNPSETIQLSIIDLAKKAYTSEASIIRFCRALDIKGFQDLKLAISADISKTANTKRVIHEKIEKTDSPQEIFDKISIGSIKAIEDTKKMIDILELERAIDEIIKAERVYLYSAGASSIVALDAQYKFTRINIPTVMYFDNHIQLTTSVHLGPKDVAIGISNSGKTKDVVDALRIAKEKGATTISITQYGRSPILNVSDIVLFTASVESNFRSGAMASRIAQLNIIDSLFMGVACRRYDEVIEYLNMTREAVANKQY
ncbi:MAG: MurR/RpiR family transcriptional regulator [Clostridia bacterium]|nr:MurR/RpiR family transcriptional regulator [Clostridia bacterium]